MSYRAEVRWIAQEYEGQAHVVPDSEPHHVLSPDCFCSPRPDDDEPRLFVHREMTP